MDTRVKELFAVGASITANCQPCLDYHLAQAREAGAGEQEIKQAIAVGRMVRKGAAGQMDEHLEKVFHSAPENPEAPPRGCASS